MGVASPTTSAAGALRGAARALRPWPPSVRHAARSVRHAGRRSERLSSERTSASDKQRVPPPAVPPPPAHLSTASTARSSGEPGNDRQIGRQEIRNCPPPTTLSTFTNRCTLAANDMAGPLGGARRRLSTIGPGVREMARRKPPENRQKTTCDARPHNLARSNGATPAARGALRAHAH